MESTEVIIARLVLGYLKGEKCKSAYKEFLKTSSHLQDDGLTKGKYLPTRFVGLTLEDILSEYFEIYKIVQGRLESTNYYNERHTKTSLVYQLLYLLNRVLSSRTSTPCPRSPIDSNLDDTSISPAEHISDVETTPAHTLPGNIRSTCADSHLHKTPRRKLHSKHDKSVTEANFPSPDKEDISEVLAQTLLENREFHEKIAQTINKVAEKQNRVSSELDKTIKTVVRETEEDPIFDKILDEIIGSTNIVECKSIETSSAPSSVTKNVSESQDRWKRSQKHSNSADEYDIGYRSYSDSRKVEEQNEEAIRSIVANSKLSANKPVDNHETQGNNEVIVFDGSLDKYLRANTCNANTQTQPVQNPLYINTAEGLIMVPSGMTSVTGNVQMDSSKQYYLVNNKQPVVNYSIPAINPPNLTEQDILAMPTVIVNDTRQVTDTSIKSVAVEPPVLKTVSEPPTLPQVVPKPVIEIPNVNEYFSFQYAMEKHQQGLRKVLYPKSAKKRKTSVNSETSDTGPSTTKTDTVNSTQNNTEPFSEELIQIQEDRPPEVNNIDNDSHESKATKPQLVKNESKTPPSSETTQKVTPKSGSHVRNLDFSTPPKITSTHKRTMKLKQGNKSPFVHKKPAVKTLFKSNDSKSTDKDGHESKVTDSINHKNMKKSKPSTWDADLRAILPPIVETNRGPKRKRTPPKTKKRMRKASKEVENQLNSTEHDAALLEAALQTPVKTDSENLKTGQTAIEDSGATKPSESEHAKTKKSNSQTKITSTNKENSEDNPNKLILSPSKLNASKRNLLKTEFVAPDLAHGLTDSPTGDPDKFITPEMVKENVNHPIKANRNITPMLETPLKNKVIPKTPRLLTPSNTASDLNMSLCSNAFTPFTKMLEANLNGIDINSLPTPSIPITPNFPPFTPTVDLISPYSNRPTDYSTSSSYYQPSDSEQNKSLEANLIELEKKPIVVLSDVVVEEKITASVSVNDKVSEYVIVNEQVITPTGSKIKSEISKNDQKKPTRATTVKEHLSIFNKNVIGKKNLNLMKRNSSSSSSSSDDDSVSEVSSDDSSWNGEQSNETVIFKKKTSETPKRIYSLRNRCTGTGSKAETIKKSSDAKETKSKSQPDRETRTNIKSKPTNKVNTKQSKESKAVPKSEEHTEEVKEKEITGKTNSRRTVDVRSFKQNVFKELEEKRLRTINKFKDVQKTSPNTSTKIFKRSKCIKIKPIANITNSRRKPRKSASPKKNVQNKTESNISKALDNDKDKDEKEKSPIPHSSKDCDKSIDKSASDVEAQNLIEGLKERGIHLMHNKSPIKKINITSGESKVDDEKTEPIDSVNLTNCSSSDSNKNDTSTSISLETIKCKLSTSELESELKDIYDTQVFEEEHECVIFDESKTITKSLEDYNDILKKKFTCKVFIDEIDAEIDVPLKLSPFITLFEYSLNSDLTATEQAKDLQNDKNDGKCIQLEETSSKINIDKPKTNKNNISLIRDVLNPTTSDETLKSDDDLMNYAIIGSGKEETPERSESPQSTRKRKHRNEENSHTEKKCKTLLKKINVDSFLNNIHGGS